MKKTKVILMGLVMIFYLSSPVYAQKEFLSDEKILSISEEKESEQKTRPTLIAGLKLFLESINKKAYADTINKDKEKQLLRERWQELLGMDIFYPYFLKKDIENWISGKTKIEFFNIKGKAKFEENQVKYVFKIKF